MRASLTDYRMTYTSTEQVLEKYKIEHSVTTDKNRTNDIQGPEEEDKQQQSTTNTVFRQITEQTILDLGHRRAQARRC
jgi:hypothetical protein